MNIAAYLRASAVLSPIGRDIARPAAFPAYPVIKARNTPGAGGHPDGTLFLETKQRPRARG